MWLDTKDLNRTAETRPETGPDRSDGLDALLGASRATLLRDLVRPRTTSELATRHRLAIGTVSEHLSILAQARLVSAHRRGRRVYYVRTTLGSHLVDARRESPEPG